MYGANTTSFSSVNLSNLAIFFGKVPQTFNITKLKKSPVWESKNIYLLFSKARSSFGINLRVIIQFNIFKC